MYFSFITTRYAEMADEVRDLRARLEGRRPVPVWSSTVWHSRREALARLAFLQRQMEV
jgi:hypothetical protein